MSIGRSLRLVIGATGLGLIVGVSVSGDSLIAGDVWVGTSALVILAVMIRDLIVAAAPEPATMTLAWALPEVESSIRGPRELHNVRALVTAGETQPRSFDRNLRPRLIAVARHFLPRRHGLDIDRDTARLEELLGDVAWMIDSHVKDRTPTAVELGRFLKILTGEDESAASSNA